MSISTQNLRIVVIGTGDIGTALIETLLAGGHTVAVGTRSPASSDQGVSSPPGGSPANPGSAEMRPLIGSARDAEVVFLAVPWHAAVDTTEQVDAPDGAIVVDATNYNRERDGVNADPGPEGTTTVLARRFPHLRWVKSFNMLWAGHLRDDANRSAPHRVIFVAADDHEAKTVVAELIADAGFVPFDNGNLADASARQLQGTPAWNQQLDVHEAAALFPAAPGAISK